MILPFGGRLGWKDNLLSMRNPMDEPKKGGGWMLPTGVFLILISVGLVFFGPEPWAGYVAGGLLVLGLILAFWQRLGWPEWAWGGRFDPKE